MIWRLPTKLDGEHVTVTYDEGSPTLDSTLIPARGCNRT